MENRNLISVVVPIYNIEGYVRKCIDSVINQTYRNLQIILVDDGSSDLSGEICDEYSTRDDRIIVIHQNNGGLSAARNSGIDAAIGDYIAFVDGDDWIHPQMYEIMLNALLQNGADMVTCQFTQDDENAFLSPIDEDKMEYRLITGTVAMSDVEVPLVVAWNKLYKRCIFAELRYPVGRLHEDEFIAHRIFHECKKIVVLDHPLYFYTIRSGSIVSKINEKRINDALDAFLDRIEFSLSSGWDDALPFAVSRYCKYCTDMYMGIAKGKIILNDFDRYKLWNLEKKMCERFSDIQLDDDYRLFAKSPQKYIHLLQRRERIRRVKEIAGYRYRVAGKLRSIINGTRSEI